MTDLQRFTLLVGVIKTGLFAGLVSVVMATHVWLGLETLLSWGVLTALLVVGIVGIMQLAIVLSERGLDHTMAFDFVLMCVSALLLAIFSLVLGSDINLWSGEFFFAFVLLFYLVYYVLHVWTMLLFLVQRRSRISSGN